MNRKLQIHQRDEENSLISILQNARGYLGDKITAAREQYDSQCFEDAWKSFQTQLSKIGNRVEDKKTELFAAATVFLQDKELLNWTKQLTDGAATVYDKAMDAKYLETHIGGGHHRLFDGGHTIGGSWDAAKNALEGDRKAREIIEWAHAYMKDLTTPMGMPYVTLEKKSFDHWVETFAGTMPGVDRQYLYDLLTFDVLEIITTGLSIAAVLFVLKEQDEQKLAEILGATGISSITAANPILGLATIFVTAYAYWKHGSIDLAGALKGGGLTAFSAFMFSVMGLPLLLELAVVLSLSVILRKYIFDTPEFIPWFKSQICNSLNASIEQLDFQRLLAKLPLPS